MIYEFIVEMLSIAIFVTMVAATGYTTMAYIDFKLKEKKK